MSLYRLLNISIKVKDAGIFVCRYKDEIWKTNVSANIIFTRKILFTHVYLPIALGRQFRYVLFANRHSAHKMSI